MARFYSSTVSICPASSRQRGDPTHHILKLVPAPDENATDGADIGQCCVDALAAMSDQEQYGFRALGACL